VNQGKRKKECSRDGGQPKKKEAGGKKNSTVKGERRTEYTNTVPQPTHLPAYVLGTTGRRAVGGTNRSKNIIKTPCSETGGAQSVESSLVHVPDPLCILKKSTKERHMIEGGCHQIAAKTYRHLKRKSRKRKTQRPGDQKCHDQAGHVGERETQEVGIGRKPFGTTLGPQRGQEYTLIRHSSIRGFVHG